MSGPCADMPVSTTCRTAPSTSSGARTMACAREPSRSCQASRCLRPARASASDSPARASSWVVKVARGPAVRVVKDGDERGVKAMLALVLPHERLVGAR